MKKIFKLIVKPEEAKPVLLEEAGQQNAPGDQPDEGEEEQKVAEPVEEPLKALVKGAASSQTPGGYDIQKAEDALLLMVHHDAEG